MEECQHWRRQEELQEVGEPIKKSHRKCQKEYLENIGNEIIEYQTTGHYDVMYMKTKEVGWKETRGIQNIGIEDSQGIG